MSWDPTTIAAAASGITVIVGGLVAGAVKLVQSGAKAAATSAAEAERKSTVPTPREISPSLPSLPISCVTCVHEADFPKIKEEIDRILRSIAEFDKKTEEQVVRLQELLNKLREDHSELKTQLLVRLAELKVVIRERTNKGGGSGGDRGSDV